VISELSHSSDINNQLVGAIGLYFVGSPRGVLPIGLDGVPGFHTALDAEILLDPSHNYTVELQGVSSNVSCGYFIESPVNYFVDGNLWHYNGTCPVGQDFLDSLYIAVPSNYSIGFWACRTAQSGNSYTLYFNTVHSYRIFGNITCTVSPIQPAVFSVNYAGQRGAFSILEQISVSPNASTDLLAAGMSDLAQAMMIAQSPSNHLVINSVLSFGVQYFGLSPSNPDSTYLRILEAMVQGILDYEVRSISC
jgi:hypothetical protein